MHNNNVLISSGCLYHPDIDTSLGINSFGGTPCNTSTIEQGAEFNLSRYLFVNGENFEYGSNVNTFNTVRFQIIFTNGLLHIPESGL